MRIARLKTKYFFIRRDQLPEVFPVPNEWAGKYDRMRIVVSQNEKQYNKDIALFGSIDKKTIKRMRKDLKNGYLYTNSPGNDSDDTHYLEDFSKPGKYQRFTKSINPEDRFDYLVYAPILDEENREVIIPIVIQSLKGHTIYGVGKYSEIEL